MNGVTVKKLTAAFTDHRGSILDIFEGPIHHTGIITFTKGAVRANHYHKKQTQYTYILTGTIELCVRDSRTPDAPVERFMMEAGDFANIPTEVIHQYIAHTDASMICLTDVIRVGNNYEEDTFRV
jgi:quercetin dioxygenase-like cupin family protein